MGGPSGRTGVRPHPLRGRARLSAALRRGPLRRPRRAIELANSFKLKGYDFHFRFGTAAHDSAQAALDLPESLAWLWRNYDPERTEQEYEMDPGEAEKPVYRVRIANRDAW